MLHLELDKWAFEIEQQLRNRTPNGNRVKLQKQLVAINKAADRAYRLGARRATVEGKGFPPRTCIERIGF